MEVNKPVSTIIIFIIILILVFLFVIPKYKESSDLQNTLAQKEAEYNGQSLYYKNMSDLLASIQSKSDALQKIDSALPSDFSFAPVVYFLQKSVTESGLAIKSMVFSGISPATPNQDVRDVTFTVDLQGSYQSLKNFLLAVDTSARLFEVNSISLSTPVNSPIIKQSKSQLPVYDFQLEIKTHTY